MARHPADLAQNKDGLGCVPPDPNPPRNQLEIQFFGLQRSGNHAVLAWIFQQFDKPVYFFNNIVPPFTDPVRNFHYADMPNTVAVRHIDSSENLQRLEKIRQADKDVLVCSYENLVLSQLRERPLVPDHDTTLGASGAIRRVLLLRDFYNWIASRIRLHEEKGGYAPSAQMTLGHISRWIGYAREFMGETTFMREEPTVAISYNRWVGDDAYRAQLLDSLGIPLRNNSNQLVPNVGGGSSFDAGSYSGRPQQMPVGDRWRYLKEDKFADALSAIRRRRAHLERYNQEIFGLPFPF